MSILYWNLVLFFLCHCLSTDAFSDSDKHHSIGFVKGASPYFIDARQYCSKIIWGYYRFCRNYSQNKDFWCYVDQYPWICNTFQCNQQEKRPYFSASLFHFSLLGFYGRLVLVLWLYSEWCNKSVLTLMSQWTQIQAWSINTHYFIQPPGTY